MEARRHVPNEMPFSKPRSSPSRSLRPLHPPLSTDETIFQTTSASSLRFIRAGRLRSDRLVPGRLTQVLGRAQRRHFLLVVLAVRHLAVAIGTVMRNIGLPFLGVGPYGADHGREEEGCSGHTVESNKSVHSGLRAKHRFRVMVTENVLRHARGRLLHARLGAASAERTVNRVRLVAQQVQRRHRVHVARVHVAVCAHCGRGLRRVGIDGPQVSRWVARIVWGRARRAGWRRRWRAGLLRVRYRCSGLLCSSSRCVSSCVACARRK